MDSGGGPFVLARCDTCMHPRMQLGGTLGGGEGHKLVDFQGWPSRALSWDHDGRMAGSYATQVAANLGVSVSCSNRPPAALAALGQASLD